MYTSRTWKLLRRKGYQVINMAPPIQKYLSDAYPEIAVQWDYEKNEDLTPDKVGSGSHKNVWWICEKGHEYQTPVYVRTSSHLCGCPYCANRITVKGLNDLPSRFPEIFAEWDNEKNGIIDPSTVRPTSTIHYWWKCPKGHSFQAKVRDRVYNNHGCPICARKDVDPGVTDLATVFPEIAARWHPTKNGNLTPDQIFARSQKKVWWMCPKGHEFDGVVADVVRTAYPCPVCNGRRIIKGVNDLASVFPEVAAEWHPTKNGDLTPDQFASHSQKKVWWICLKGHSYEAHINHKTIARSGCPFCTNKKLLPGFNDLEAVCPDLVSEWHPTFNGDITPRNVLGGSNKKYWWKCMQGHSWCASVYSRKRGSGCPVCARIQRSKSGKKTRQEQREERYASIIADQQEKICSLSPGEDGKEQK